MVICTLSGAWWPWVRIFKHYTKSILRVDYSVHNLFWIWQKTCWQNSQVFENSVSTNGMAYVGQDNVYLLSLLDNLWTLQPHNYLNKFRNYNDDFKKSFFKKSNSIKIFIVIYYLYFGETKMTGFNKFIVRIFISWICKQNTNIMI